MSDRKVLVTTAYLGPGGAVDQKLREAGLEPTFLASLNQITQKELDAEIADAVAIIAGTEQVGDELFEAMPNLEVISRTGVGYDNVDIRAATSHGIAVTATPGVNSVSVAEMAFALILACARNVPQNVIDIRAGSWLQPSGRELRGATLGIVGFGAIGRAVAEIAHGFGMEVLAYDPFVPETDFASSGVRMALLDEIVSVSDIVTLHILLNAETRHLFGAKRLAQMKQGAILINTARGGIVDDEALADAIEAGHLGAAGLDVVENEPLPAEHRLLTFPNVVVTAHIAGATVNARQRSSLMAAEQVINHLAGKEVSHVVNRAELVGLAETTS